MSEFTRLTWQEGQYTTANGTADGLRLFSITWKSRREDPNWLMRTELPGYAGREWRHDDKEHLQRQAEELLDAWLVKVGDSRTKVPS